MKEIDTKLAREWKREIKKYKKLKNEDKKVGIRNSIYLEMMPWLLIWVKNIIGKWGREETEQEILSLSWDCYIFALTYYNNLDVPLAYHFYDYSRLCLLQHYAKKDEGIHVELEELKYLLFLEQSPESISFVNLLTLYQFREIIPDKYKIIFDDAAQSLSPRPTDRKTSKHEFSQPVYYAVKDILRPIIKKIIGMN